MINLKTSTGKRGEDIACNFFKKIGYKIIDRNFRMRDAEIDIVAIDESGGLKNKILVFIEVKTRRSKEFGEPFEAITPWKLRSLRKAVDFYKATHHNLPEALRIDAVSVVFCQDDTIFRVEHIENISGF